MIGLFIVCEGQRELLEQLNDVTSSRTVRLLDLYNIGSSYSNVAEDLKFQSGSSVI
jgi:hypothetical protein